MNKEEYKNKFEEEDAVGWLSIDEVTEKLYPNQEPKHYATILKRSLGGDDPLDGVSIYECKEQEEHFHFVSYGMSNLYYNEENAGGEFSKWGFEFTFRLAPFKKDKGDPTWVVSLMQNLARYVFESNNWFEEYHFIPTNSPIRLECDTELTAIAFVEDTKMGTINTPHGVVQFLQLVGITSTEYEQLKVADVNQTKVLLDKLRENNPLLITDLNRKS